MTGSGTEVPRRLKPNVILHCDTKYISVKSSTLAAVEYRRRAVDDAAGLFDPHRQGDEISLGLLWGEPKAVGVFYTGGSKT